MNNPASQQLNAIHSMLASGHRNLRIERHSLVLWGIPTGVLFALSEVILTAERIPDTAQRAFAWLALLSVVLLVAGGLDWLCIRRAKRSRDEAWSFVHRQIQKVWWLLMGLAALTTFAMFFFGGGYMVCALWLVVGGIGLYLHGLFSEELLEWVGVTMILIGISCLLSGLPYETMRWLTATVFAGGLPLLAMMLDRGRHRAALFRLGQMMIWLMLIFVLPLWIVQMTYDGPPADTPTVSLEEFRKHGSSGPFGIVALAAGTTIPVTMEINGDILEGAGDQSVLHLALRQPIEFLLKNGTLTGDARLPGESWQASRQARWINIPWLKAELTQEKGPFVTGSVIVQLRPQ